MPKRSEDGPFDAANFLPRLSAGLGLLVAVVLCLVGLALIQSLRNFERHAEVTTQNLSITLAQNIDGAIDKVDIGLLAAADEIERQLALGSPDAAALAVFMTRLQKRLPWVIGLRATDETGNVRYGVDVPAIGTVNVAERSYFVRLRDDPGLGLYINRPVLSYINKVWVVNFARRLRHADGRFAGVVFANISLENFSKMFSVVNVGPYGAVNLRDGDMGLIVRHPAPSEQVASIGKKDISPEFRGMLESGHTSGTFHTPTSFDHTARIVSFRKVGDYPLFVTVGLARDDFLEPWRREAMQMVGLALLFVAISVGGLLLIRRVWRRQQEAMLRLAHEEQRFHTVADYTYDWEYWEGEDQAIRYMSPSCRRLTGYGADEFQARPELLLDIVHADDRAVLDAHRHRADHPGLAEIDFRIVRRDGAVHWISHCCQAVFGQDGSYLGRRISNRDITERKRNEAVNAARLHLIRYSLAHSLDELLEETLNETERLTGSSIGFYHFVDPDQDTLWLQNWSTRTKAEFCQAEGKGLHYPVSQAGVWADCVRERRPLIHNDYAALANRKGMPEGHAEVVRELVVPVYRGEFVSAILGVGNKPTDYTDQDLEVVSLIADLAWEIAERKRNEDELKRYKDQLEEKVQQRTADLVLARNAAEAANKAKSVFLASMSHELRTPLNAILGFSNMMRGNAQLPPDLHQDLDIINRSGEHLLTLINDVLEMAKIESGRVQLENAAFDLGSMVRDITDMMELRAREKGLRLLIDQASRFPRYIVGDEARLRQVLINLLGNAVKFTAQGGVTLRLGTKENKVSHLLIEIEDSGPGIPAEDQQRIFEPFIQLGAQRSSKGTGLGLTISRQFIQMMGGSISLASVVGKGSLFRIDLPLTAATESDLAVAAVAAEGSVIGVAPGQPAFRILVVEDQLENQLLLAKLMEAAGLQVKVAENGAQGVEAFLNWHPHLIWMDRQMPVMDGVEATKRIRCLPGGKEVKIVAVTASAFTEQRAEIIDAGMDDFVRKPYRFSEIYDCLSRQIGVRFVRECVAEAEATAVTLTPEMLAALPKDLRERLWLALESLEPERIAAIVREAGGYDQALEKVLSRLSEGFDYPTILNALQPLRSGVS